MLNHSEKPAKNIKLKLPDNSINEMTVFDQETCSTKKIKAIRSSGDPVFEIPAFKYGTIAMFILN
jgi:hypothetical protein